MFWYNTLGIFAKAINFEIEGNQIKNITFVAGCNGNLKDIGALVEVMDIDEVIARLAGITCDAKKIACSDQLAKAQKAYKTENTW